MGRALLVDAPGSVGYSSGYVISNGGWLLDNFACSVGSRAFGAAFVNCIELSNSGYSEIKNMGFVNTSGWAIRAGRAGAMKIHNNWLATHEGIELGWDSYCYNNDISFGGNIITTANITSTGWSKSAGKYTHTHGNTNVLIFRYDGSKATLLKEMDCYVVKVVITNRTKGSCSPLFCHSLDNGMVGECSENGTYTYMLQAVDVSKPTLTFTPSSDFDGTLSVSFYHGKGIAVTGAGNSISDNKVYGDGGGAFALLFQGGDACVNLNRLGPAAFGCCFGAPTGCCGGAKLVNNEVGSGFAYCYVWRNVEANSITIDGGSVDGSWSHTMAAFSSQANGPWLNLNGTVIRNVRVAGTITQGFKSDGTPGLMENNPGIDIGTTFPTLTVNSATPDVQLGRNWKTANTSDTTITDFMGKYIGKEVNVIIGDGHTTLKFSGESRLKGHGGVDWRPGVGDHLRACKGDDGFWYCECFASNK